MARIRSRRKRKRIAIENKHRKLINEFSKLIQETENMYKKFINKVTENV